ncbi:MAG: MaoC/PaaZ C-terminal domain-containing protein [Dehalococcoidales bacterium]|nr:MaoC/PaaZ C-terminal domain-containing protein [Dehalococcoidales bacterium]
MTKQVYWEEIEIGNEVTPLVKKPTTQQLVKWAGASGDFYQIHYDKDYALGNQLPGCIVHGALKGSWLGQLLGDWVGEKGKVLSYGCSYRSMDVPGDTLTCKGKVTKKYIEGKEHRIEAEIWVENGKGEKTTPGTGVVILPSKK